MSLNVGEVFRGLNFAFSGREPHRYLVVSKTTANEVIVVFFTTSLEKSYKACRRDELDLHPLAEPETYIEFESTTLPNILTEKSAINCNKVDVNHESVYENDPVFIRYGSITSQDTLNKIKNGIRHSGTVKEKIIKLL